MIEQTKTKLLNFYEQNEARADLAFFIGGFLFDIIFMSDPDDLLALTQQTIYLLMIGSFLHHEILFRTHKWRPRGRWISFWNYRNLILHFILGSLLSTYSLFYIKSSSLLSSLVFLIVMLGILIANELPVVKNSKVSFKYGMFGICLFSFLSMIFPVALGFVGWIPFSLAILSTCGLFYLEFKLLEKKLQDQKLLARAILLPGFSVLILFSAFYFMGWIPPVPISATEQGIYHNIEKSEGRFLLSTERPWWKFWQSGDQDFKAQPGDKIYYYTQIYSPARFSDEVWIRWFYKDPKRGWQSADRIPMKIVGGRKEGFRGFAVKSNYQSGEWKVQVETDSGQEIARMYLEVTPEPPTQGREFQILAR